VVRVVVAYNHITFKLKGQRIERGDAPEVSKHEALEDRRVYIVFMIVHRQRIGSVGQPFKPAELSK
jgi:hypothetical protein